GRIHPSEELLDFRIVEGSEPVEITDGVFVRRLALNRFEFSYHGRMSVVDLNLGPGECYEAPYTLGQHRIDPQYFGIVHSGEGDGWDVRRHGMEVMPLESPHPVENNVFLMRVRDDETYRTYAHWADIVSLDVLRRLLSKPPASDVMPPDFLE